MSFRTDHVDSFKSMKTEHVDGFKSMQTDHVDSFKSMQTGAIQIGAAPNEGKSICLYNIIKSAGFHT
jgi:hypothetical protein